MLNIEGTMDSFLNLIRDKVEGGPFSRFKSWEYCYQQFNHYHELNRELTDDEIDLLALHLSFYLASWGMYRGSSFILQRDYKTHREIVRRIFKDDYRDLWCFDPLNKTDDELNNVANTAARAYKDICNAYCVNGVIPERYFVEDSGDENKPLSITLITKILMGTFAISPAYDRFFLDGVSLYKKNHPTEDICKVPFTENNYKKSLIYLFKFANGNHRELNRVDSVPTSISYPMMKKVDMYFWEVGYEKGFYDSLKKKRSALNGNPNFINPKSKRPFVKIVSQIKILFSERAIGQGTDLEKINHLISFFEGRLL